MDAAELRAMQAPIKERYKSDPSAAVITLKAKGSIDDEGIACKVETGRALAIAGLHPATGGSGLELCSGDMLLEALVAYAGVTLKSVATAVEVPLKSGTVIAEGDLDFRGTLGVDKEAPVGFEEIRLRFEVGTDAPQDKLDLLLKLTERYCVGYQTIKNGPKISVSINRVSSLVSPPLEREGPRACYARRGGVKVSPRPTAPELRDHATPSRISLRSCDPTLPLQGRVRECKCPPNSLSSSRSPCAWRSPRRSW